MAAKILDSKAHEIDELKLVPSGGGAFEVTIDDKLVWSKRKTKQFPTEADIIGAI